MSKCGVFSGPYFRIFGLNTRKCGPEKTPYTDTFHPVVMIESVIEKIAEGSIKTSSFMIHANKHLPQRFCVSTKHANEH